jgi:hypothetical protein
MVSPLSIRLSTISSAQLEVTTQSARAFTAADVLAYTTTVRSGCWSQKPRTLDRAAQVERAGGLQGRHQHALFRGEDFRRLAHEAHTGHDHRVGRVVLAEAGHFQRVGHAAAGFLGQGLDHRVAIVMGDQHGILGLQLGSDGRTVFGLLRGCQRVGLLGVEVGLNQQAFGNLGHDRWTCRRAYARQIECITRP